MKMGECSVCLQDRPLSYEHIPPKKALNSTGVIAVEFERALKLKPWENAAHGKILQQGAGRESLCEECNNNTGAWYGNEYISWVDQADRWLRRRQIDPNVWPIFGGYPLRFLKQVATMVLATAGPDFTRVHPDLQRFVLDRQRRFMGNGVHIHAYYNTSRHRARYSGPIIIGGLSFGRGFSVFSEVAKYPFGFILTERSQPPDERLFEITNLTQYGFDDGVAVLLPLPAFPVVLPMPGIYLTPEEATSATDPVHGPIFFEQNREDPVEPSPF